MADAGSRSRPRGAAARDRAVAPVVGKALEASLVVLFVGLLATTLYGGLVPHYRTTAGAEVGERVLSKSAQRVQQAVPTDARTVRVRAEVSLPRTIRGSAYAIRVRNRSLVLDHPHGAIGANGTLGGRARLALPETVESVSGSWSSREPAFVVVRSNGSEGLAVRLESGGDGG